MLTIEPIPRSGATDLRLALPLDVDRARRTRIDAAARAQRRLIGAGEHERVSGAGARSRFAERKQAWPRRPTARPRLVLSERHALVHSHARLEPVVGLPAIAAKAIVRVSFPWVAALSSVALVDVGRGY